jgi:hypothetical protein
LHFWNHAAPCEAHFFANRFRNDFAAVGSNHIAVFFSYIACAGHSPGFHAGFPNFFAYCAVGKLSRAAAYMPGNINHLATAGIHGPKSWMTYFSHHNLTGDFANFCSP